MTGYATLRHGGKTTICRSDDGTLRDLWPAGSAPGLVDCLGDLDALSTRAGSTIAEPDEWLPPVAGARYFCMGHNYLGHIHETGAKIPEHPVVFLRLPESFVGHRASIEAPSVSDRFDYEGELAVVLGSGGRDVPEEEAMELVAGYCCASENSVRDWQFHSPTAFAGKNFHRSGSIGPWITPASEISDPHDLRLRTFLNGELVQDGSTGDMLFRIPAVISYLSKIMPLRAGDTILTGTPSGVGMRRDPPLWLRPGDRLTVEIEDLGRLENQVSARS